MKARTTNGKEPSRSVNFWAPDSLHRKLKQAALDQGITSKEVILRALRQYLGVTA